MVDSIRACNNEDWPSVIAKLKPLAESGRPLMMLELCHSIMLTQSEKKEDLREAWKWFNLGTHCLKLDAACTNRKDNDEWIGSYIWSYHPFRYSTKNQKQKSMKENFHGLNFELRSIQEWKPDASKASPEWVEYNARGYPSHTTFLKRETEWLKSRQDAHSKIVSALRARVQEGKDPTK